MTRIAATLLAAASLALAAPAAAQDTDACNAADLLYSVGENTWIDSNGLVDATQRMGGEYPGYFMKLWSEASDGEQGFDVEVEHTLYWFDTADDASAAESIARVGRNFADAAEGYRHDKRELEGDIRATRRDVRHMQHQVRKLQALLGRMLDHRNYRAASLDGKADQLRKKIHSVTAEMNAARADLQELRQEHREVARAASDLEDGVIWAKTMACIAEGRR